MVHTRLGKHRSLEEDIVKEQWQRFWNSSLTPCWGRDKGKDIAGYYARSRELRSALGCYEVSGAKLQLAGQQRSPSTC